MKHHPQFTLIKPTAQELENLFTLLTGRVPTPPEMAELRYELNKPEYQPQLGSQYDGEDEESE